MIEGEILQPVLAEWEKTSLAKELEGLRDAVDALAARAGLKLQESARSTHDPGT
jgi:hypothetical protein